MKSRVGKWGRIEEIQVRFRMEVLFGVVMFRVSYVSWLYRLNKQIVSNDDSLGPLQAESSNIVHQRIVNDLSQSAKAQKGVLSRSNTWHWDLSTEDFELIHFIVWMEESNLIYFSLASCRSQQVQNRGSERYWVVQKSNISRGGFFVRIDSITHFTLLMESW